MSKLLKVLFVSAGIALGLVGQAQAALPTSVGTTMTDISTNVQSIFDLAFPIVALGLGLTVVIKLFKRFANKI